MSSPIEEIACPHVDIRGDLHIEGLVDSAENVRGYHVEVKVWCGDCLVPFVWKGPEVGYSPAHPTVNYDGDVLFAPMRPKDYPDDFGGALPTINVRQRIGLNLIERTDLITKLAAVIANPSIMTPRMFVEGPEYWAARGVLKLLES